MSTFVDVIANTNRSRFLSHAAKANNRTLLIHFSSLKLPPFLILLDLETLYSMIMGGSIRLNPCGLLCLGLASLLILYYAFGRTDNREKISIKEVLAASIDVAKKGGYELKKIRELDNVSIKTWMNSFAFPTKFRSGFCKWKWKFRQKSSWMFYYDRYT